MSGIAARQWRLPGAWPALLRIDGSPMVYNQRDTYLPDLLICRPEFADKILAMLRE